MILSRLATLLTLTALSSAPALLAQSRAPIDAGDDARVYQAVLQHTLRTFVVSFSNRMDALPPSPLLVTQETMAFCRPSHATPGCISRELVESSARSLPAPFPTDLMKAFLERNANPRPFPRDLAPDLVLIPHDAIEETLREWRERAVGSLAFSLPGYSPEGRALVWVSYVCEFCNRGWLFTLHQDAGMWKVEDVKWTLASGVRFQ